MKGVFVYIGLHAELGPRINDETNPMTLPSRYKIKNLSPDCLRPSTLPLSHGVSPQYWAFTGEGWEICFWHVNASTASTRHWTNIGPPYAALDEHWPSTSCLPGRERKWSEPWTSARQALALASTPRYRPNVRLLLARSLRRRPSNNQTLGRYLVFAGVFGHSEWSAKPKGGISAYLWNK